MKCSLGISNFLEGSLVFPLLLFSSISFIIVFLWEVSSLIPIWGATVTFPFAAEKLRSFISISLQCLQSTVVDVNSHFSLSCRQHSNGGVEAVGFRTQICVEILALLWTRCNLGRNITCFVVLFSGRLKGTSGVSVSYLIRWFVEWMRRECNEKEFWVIRNR